MHSISINQSSDDFQVVSGVWMNMQGVFMGHVLTADKGGVFGSLVGKQRCLCSQKQPRDQNSE